MSQRNSGNNQSFMDRGTVMALVLVGLVWFGWSKWMEKTYPPQAAPTAAVGGDSAAAPTTPATVAQTAESAGPAAATKVTGAAAKTTSEPKSKAEPEKTIGFESAALRGTISSLGMGLRSVEIRSFQSRDGKPIVVALDQVGVGAVGLIGDPQPLNFDVQKTGETEWLGTANVGGYKVEKKLSLVTEGPAAGMAFNVAIQASGDLSAFPGFSVQIRDEVRPPAAGSFFAPSYDHYDWYIRHEDSKTRQVLAPDKPESLERKIVYSAALSSHYFTSAIADRSDLRPDYVGHAVEATAEAGRYTSRGALEYKPLSKNDAFVVREVVYIGPKDVDSLRAADPELARVIDYGMFAVIAEPLLWLLRLFHRWFGNWGFAIIGLTLVVRTLVLPFNVYSFKSMKVMQKLQPQIQSVRARYKDDPKRMNEEVMKLMRENKANPIGGCLPMLLQLPVFFALYQVLAMSIELYQQPFIFWIHDLSVRDPYFVLPVLMGISMFVQQKITPVADPQQAKILMWMPVLFSFLMLSLPSGLTLYIFVSTIFGIAQQALLMRDRSAPQEQKTVREAKA